MSLQNILSVGYSCLCEQVRMTNITQTFGGVPVLWIRYNPDKFKNPDKTYSTISDNKREKHLLEWVKYARDNVPTEFQQVIHLFFDGCEDRRTPNDIVTMQSWEHTKDTDEFEPQDDDADQ